MDKPNKRPQHHQQKQNQKKKSTPKKYLKRGKCTATKSKSQFYCRVSSSTVEKEKFAVRKRKNEGENKLKST
jgi:hypothetical protein